MTTELRLFCLHYADFCYGDASNESCSNFEQAKRIALAKPKASNVAYQYWKGHGRIYTKPCGRGAHWTNLHTGDGSNGQGHLFVWAYDTGHRSGNRILIHMKGVDAAGGPSDGKITHGVKSY